MHSPWACDRLLGSPAATACFTGQGLTGATQPDRLRPALIIRHQMPLQAAHGSVLTIVLLLGAEASARPCAHRSQRYQTVQELLLDLQAFREDSQFHARS